MGISTTLTIGTTAYDVYGLTSDPLADAKTYMTGRFGTEAWDAASTNNKRKALVSAARQLDRQRWTSVPTDVATPQPMEWPRAVSEDCNGTAVLDTVVPDQIVEAEFELAQLILADSEVQEVAGQGTNLKRAKGGEAEVEFFRYTVGTSRDTKLPAIVHDLVKCFLGTGGDIGIPYISGAGKGSVFDDDNNSSLSRGYS